MTYVLDYSRWRALFEDTGEMSIVVKEIETKILDKLKKYGLTMDELKKDMAALTPAPDLPETPYDFDQEPAQPEGPFQVTESRRLYEGFGVEYVVDIAVDVISGILDGFPVLGQAASGAIDITHTISYALRLYFATEIDHKIEYLVALALGATSMFLPVGGNVANIVSRTAVGRALQVCPNKIYAAMSKLKGKELPITHWSNFAKWKINFMFVLLKVAGNFANDMLQIISKSFNTMYSKVYKILNNWAKDSYWTGWIATDYILPALKKVKDLIGGFAEVTGLAELKAAAKS